MHVIAIAIDLSPLISINYIATEVAITIAIAIYYSNILGSRV
jgi:hypothetical protein